MRHGIGSIVPDGRGPGSVWIDGIEVNARTAHQVRRKVGLLFQDPDDQLFCSTVIEDVAFGPLNQGIAGERGPPPGPGVSRPGRARGRGGSSAASSELRRAEARLPGGRAGLPALGGGARRADGEPRPSRPEAVHPADPRPPATKLIATHDLELVLEICPRTILLDQGEVVADGPSREILANASLVEAHGLEMPLSLALGRQGESP